MEKSKVYFTKEITPESIVRIYEALGKKLEGKVAVKLHSGERGNQNYIRPEMVKNIVEHVNGTVVECNTAYGGSRANTAMHYQMAEDYGYPAEPQLIIYSAALGHVALFVRIACCFLCGIAAV